MSIRVTGRKTCATCGIDKPIEDFKVNHRNPRKDCRLCVNAYLSRRSKLKRRGLWNPTRMWGSTPVASRPATPRDIEWVAGFLEGEGCFKAGQREMSVEAAQVDMEPLLKIQSLLGGSVYLHSRASGNRQTSHIWKVNGTRARGVMFTVFALMSRRRKDQILNALRLNGAIAA